MDHEYLRLHMRSIATDFGADVTDSNQYCQGTRSYDWRTGVPLEKPAGEYERELQDFLLSNPSAISKQGLDALVIIGGIGTGKSTTMREMVRRVEAGPRACSGGAARDGKCHLKPIIIDFNVRDIFGESTGRTVDKARVKVQLDDFWNTAASRLESILGDALSFDAEVAFWHWAVTSTALRERSRTLHRWLNDCALQIRAYVTKKPYAGWTLEAIGESLERQRSDLMNRISDRDLVWYRVYQLLYAIDVLMTFQCRCRYVFLDNVDQLEPDVQREVVDFVILLSDVLRARTLIAIRPLTWERSPHAHMIVRTQNHFSPALRDVLLTRLRQFEKQRGVPHGAVPYLRSLILTFTAPNSIWGDLYDATSGLSVRFALRNFLNILQSPILPPLAEHVDPFAALKVSQIARAFFFGEGQNILHKNLENLYSLGTDMRREFRLIKARILDYLVRVCDEGAAEVEQLVNVLTLFQYTPRNILRALNDLLLSTRPLLWSQIGYQLPSLSSRGKVAITPIGRGYHTKLFGQLYYDEVCIAKSSTDIVELDRVLEFQKELWAQDQEEIKIALRRHGPGMYRTLYPQDKPAISAIHAMNLHEGVQNRKLPPPPGYDAQRVDYIAHEVEKLMTPRWTQ